ncbi:MAG TPA: MgtC/SapB family protein [Candidatus Sulfotelmatobacter sp.]|jgi:uncharacterized membrane protein (DUF4010 family)|nr:MgtC/SapB family protein [Candidatus Sulfotelmatobacter sp.]
MQTEYAHFPVTPIALKMGVAIGIGMLAGMEREWSNKDVGIRTFAIVALLGMLASLIGQNVAVAALIGVFLLVAAMNTRSILTNHSLEITTSAALMVIYLLGLLVGLGHIFTPVAGAIVMTMLLAWKTELTRFAGGLQPSEIRSAVLLGLIGFVIYPVLPNRYLDPWQLFNPSDAWISVIAIAGIGFLNYVLLRIYSTRGLYLGALFGGLVNSSATVAELGTRMRETGMVATTTTLCLLTTIAMFARNLVLATIFSPRSLSATLVPLLAMTLVAGFWIWRDRKIEETIPGTLTLTSPISLAKVIWFGLVFVSIQIVGTLLTKYFGSYGMFATGIFGGLVSSASTTAAAATMAMHGKISAALAGSATVLTSLSSAAVNLPIVWRTTRNRAVVRRLTIQMATVIGTGVAVVTIDRIFQFSELLVRR